MPVYDLAVPEENGSLKTALDCAWESILTGDQSVENCEKQLEITMELIHTIPPKAGSFKLYAEDPIAAVAYTLRTIISDNPEEPTWAAQRMFETVTRYIGTQEQFALKGPDLVKELIKQPLMQAEFSRQFEDLEQLIECTVETGRKVRTRAEENSALPNALM